MKQQNNAPKNVGSTKKSRAGRRRFFGVILLIIMATATYFSAKYIINNSDGKEVTGSNNTAAGENNNDDQVSQTTEPTLTPTLSPTPSPTPIPVAEQKNLDELKASLNEYIGKYTGKYGIHFKNLVGTAEFGINDEDEYIAASTVKIPLNLLVFKKIEEGSLDPSELLTVTDGDMEPGTGSLQYKGVGKKYSIRTLSKYSIEQSDNVATNMLIRRIGKPNMKNFMRELGGTIVDDKKNISCPKDMAIYIEAVYNFEKENPELGGELLGYLENTIYNERIPAKLPNDVVVAHKVGNQVRAVHDVGIIYSTEPYILSIMSEDVNDEGGKVDSEANKVIATISEMVYNFLN